MKHGTSGNQVRAEVVVIGSGPGDSTTAYLLAEHGKDVLIVEEGPDLPLDPCPPFSIKEMAQKYRAGGLNPMLGNARVTFVEGCCVGGGSEINSGLYHRMPPEILSQWQREFRVRELSPDDLLPHFQCNEQALQVQRVRRVHRWHRRSSRKELGDSDGERWKFHGVFNSGT